MSANAICLTSLVIPGRDEVASPESITPVVVIDSGPAPDGASRNDEPNVFAAPSYRVCLRMNSVIRLSASTDAGLVGFREMKVCGSPSNFRSVILPPALA